LEKRKRHLARPDNMRSNCKPLTLESLMAMRSVVAMLQNLSASCCVFKEPIRMIKPIQNFLLQHHQNHP
jgi:hypothetical protein